MPGQTATRVSGNTHTCVPSDQTPLSNYDRSISAWEQHRGIRSSMIPHPERQRFPVATFASPIPSTPKSSGYALQDALQGCSSRLRG